MTGWRARAACEGLTPLFYVEGAGVQHALDVCAGCPVRSECLAEALDQERVLPIDYVVGVRGGLTAAERAARLRADPERRVRAAVAVCGTDSGYYRHRRQLGEEACDECKAAHTAAVTAANSTPARKAAWGEHTGARRRDQQRQRWLAEVS